MSTDSSRAFVVPVPRQVFRQWSAWMVAGTLGLLGLGIIVAALVATIRSGMDVATLGFGLFLLAAGYAWCLRPCVVVDSSGVLIRNVVRDVRIPWSAVEETQVRWQLVVIAEGRRHSSFAIAATPGPSRRARRAAADLQPRPDRMSTADIIAAGLPAPDAHAATVAMVIDHGAAQYGAAVRAGRVPAPGEPVPKPVVASTAWWVVVLFAVPIALAWLGTL